MEVCRGRVGRSCCAGAGRSLDSRGRVSGCEPGSKPARSARGGGLDPTGYTGLAQNAGHVHAGGLGLTYNSAPIWTLVRPSASKRGTRQFAAGRRIGRWNVSSSQPAAAAVADGHAPLLAQIRTLAGRARIPLQEPAAPADIGPVTLPPAPSGLTDRELAVLRLLASGRTNAQFGAELYVSPKTASVHVTIIFRELQVSNRVRAAAWAERVGLLPAGDPEAGLAGT
jgi:DNA-binding CsgD family transcriptional regulator